VAAAELKDLNPSIDRVYIGKAFEDFVDLFDPSTIGPALIGHNPQRNSDIG